MSHRSEDSCLNRHNIELAVSGNIQGILQVIYYIFHYNHIPNLWVDIYHSYLGLAALATMKEPGLKDFDPELCISIQARENINNSRKTISIPTRIYWKHGYSFPVREDDPLFEEKMSSSEEPPKSLRNAFRTAQAPR